jgi:hypothetical protein
MTKRTQMSAAVLVSVAVILFGGCSKQSNAPVSHTSETLAAAASHASEESVLTPAGYMPKSKVHFIEAGFHVNVEGGHYKKVEDATGKIVQDFGEADPIAVPDNINLGEIIHLPNSIEPKPSGWITYAYWSNDTTTGTPVTFFHTRWRVPNAPKSDDNQTVFLFNGMQDGFGQGAHILQPVLQWGQSEAGGGNYWSITNWYVGSSAFYGALVQVPSGTHLEGVMQQTGQSGSLHSYSSSFVNYPATNITISNAPQLWWAAETLETYGIAKDSDYPAQQKIRMDGIHIKQGTQNATLSWTAVKAFKSGKQNTTVVSDNSPDGEVDIYFR